MDSLDIWTLNPKSSWTPLLEEEVPSSICLVIYLLILKDPGIKWPKLGEAYPPLSLPIDPN